MPRASLGICLILLDTGTVVTALELPVASQAELALPALVDEAPAAGKRVRIPTPSSPNSSLYYTVYLPPTWSRDAQRLPIIFEFTGNKSPTQGTTGNIDDARLGFGISAGQCIWVVLPFVDTKTNRQALNWWGDINATVAYAKKHVPEIVSAYHADGRHVTLCGFSRGAIAVSFIGLYDDDIAKLWTNFVTHDHFDGVRKWEAPWGAPLARYRQETSERLQRLNKRPVLVCENGDINQTRTFISDTLGQVPSFTFLPINTEDILGEYPNSYAKTNHNDAWLLKPSPARAQVWAWFNAQWRQ